jgi:hypothetical protein
LEGSTTTGTPPEERAQRERISQTTVVKIKNLEHECIKICDEGTCMWTEMTNTLEIQALDKKIRVAHEQTIHATECTNIFPPTERMTTLSTNRKLHLVVEQMKEE